MPNDTPVVLVTGAALRIGAVIARTFHHKNYRVLVHYRRSDTAATTLVNALNAVRPGSAAPLQADLTKREDVEQLGQQALALFGRLDVLVNNASSFYPTPFGHITQFQWDDLADSNLRAAFFLAQAVAPELGKRAGAIVNLVDIHADTPLKEHSVYSIAKAGVKAMTKALALELAPAVRVNGVAPGAILWPTPLVDDTSLAAEQIKQTVLSQIPLGQIGNPQHIADTVYFLAVDAAYMTGTVVRVDGGRHLNQ